MRFGGDSLHFAVQLEHQVLHERQLALSLGESMIGVAAVRAEPPHTSLPNDAAL